MAMDLETLVADTLEQISNGIRKITKLDKSFTISESVVWRKSGDDDGLPIEYIDFEVYLTEQEGKTGNRRVRVCSPEEASKTPPANVKFRIPIFWDANGLRDKKKNEEKEE